MIGAFYFPHCHPQPSVAVPRLLGRDPPGRRLTSTRVLVFKMYFECRRRGELCSPDFLTSNIDHRFPLTKQRMYMKLIEDS